MAITREDVLRALGEVQEPDLGKDLVTLNMIEDIRIDGLAVSFTVILTTPACPLKEMIEKACVNAIRMLGRGSIGSCPRRRRAFVMRTPCDRASSTTS